MFIYGIHFGQEKEIINVFKFNLATPFDAIIRDIKEQLNNKDKNELKINDNKINENLGLLSLKDEIIKNENNTKIDEKIEYRNEINLIYFSEKEEVKKIFGNKFVKNNRNNIELKINGIKNGLIDRYKLNKGDNIITLIIKNDLTDLSFMFKDCYSLKNIEELKYLNTSNVKDFSYIFSSNDDKTKFSFDENKRSYCILLNDINPLKYWNVSKGINFVDMFRYCMNLSDIKALEKWDVSNCTNFSNIFNNCESLSNINPLKNWNVSKGITFKYMFRDCRNLSDIKALENWDVSNCEDFSRMFSGCHSLSNHNPIKN